MTRPYDEDTPHDPDAPWIWTAREDYDYIKRWYELNLGDGDVVLSAWPNAGKWHPWDRPGPIEAWQVIGVRPGPHPMDLARKAGTPPTPQPNRAERRRRERGGAR